MGISENKLRKNFNALTERFNNLKDAMVAKEFRRGQRVYSVTTGQRGRVVGFILRKGENHYLVDIQSDAPDIQIIHEDDLIGVSYEAIR